MRKPNFGALLTIALLLVLTCGGSFCVRLASAEPSERLSIQVSFGHRSAERTTLTPRFAPGSRGVEVAATAREISIGAGAVEVVKVDVSWQKPAAEPRKPHSTWQYLLDNGTPDQVLRLKSDPGVQPDAPLLTVLTASDGTRGFSICLEQLREQKAMWLPEHDAFVTLADSPVGFSAHLASLKGERVLDRVRREPEATLTDWTNKWEDTGNPVQYDKPWETSWLGTKGHLTGTVARHGSIYKFGIDRWGNVRPDHASPHMFRLDFTWQDCKWSAQRIVDGLPILSTTLKRNGQSCEIEQFAAPLRDTPTEKRGEIPSVLFSRIRVAGAGPMNSRFRLGTENTNRHPELRQMDNRFCVVDRETGAVWLMIEPEAGVSVAVTTPGDSNPNTIIEFECAGDMAAGEARTVVLKLPSPAVPADAVTVLAGLDIVRSRAATVQYWENWLARGARFDVPEKHVNDLFRANLWHALMLPRFRTSPDGVECIDLPYSNFAYGQLNADWPVNQAVYVDYMLYGLRGHFAVATDELAAMFVSQQKADGRIGGYADWGVNSPAMLYAVAKNYLLSHDRTAFERLLPYSLKALDWCLAQVEQAGKSTSATGLIVAPLNDLTHESRAWAFPNAYFFAGLDKFGRALDVHGHPRAAEVRTAADKMRECVEREFGRACVRSPLVQLADGSWINYVPCDALTPRRLLEQWYPTDVDTGPLHLARLAAVNPRGLLATAMINDHEDNLFLNQLGMANEPVYNPHGTVYLMRDEPEAAIRTFYSMIACAFSHNQLTPLEHRWAWSQYHMPPSTDGAWFELYRNMLLNELSDDGTLFVGQAVPRQWLADGKQIVVAGAPTCFGPVNLRIQSDVSTGMITAAIEFLGERRPSVLLLRLRHPEKKPLRSAVLNDAPWTDLDAAREWIRIPNPSEARYMIIARY